MPTLQQLQNRKNYNESFEINEWVWVIFAAEKAFLGKIIDFFGEDEIYYIGVLDPKPWTAARTKATIYKATNEEIVLCLLEKS